MLLSSEKPRRFFYHFYRQKGKMTVHFLDKCHIVQDVICEVPCATKWNKRQPYLVMRGFAKKLEISDDGDRAIIS
jgi:hypothetical protein